MGIIVVPIILLFPIIATFIVFFFYGFVYDAKLDSYLFKNRHDRWCELTNIGGAVGCSNPFKWFPYIYGNLDDEDEYIAQCKAKIRAALRHILFAVVAAFLDCLVILGLAILANHA